MRSSTGCWTCRLRRKKCDESVPVCFACSSLLITCHYSADRPPWMDGGPLQAAMAEQLKQELKSKAPFRLRGHTTQQLSSDDIGDGSGLRDPLDVQDLSATETSADGVSPNISHSQATRASSATSYSLSVFHYDSRETSYVDENGRQCPTLIDRELRNTVGPTCLQASRDVDVNISLGRSDALMATHYIDYVMPLLFPCYEHPVVTGGQSWMLELLLTSPLIRQSAVHQSEFFFSLAPDTTNQSRNYEEILTQSNEIFTLMRYALQILIDSGIKEHFSGAARMMIGMMHWMHFEIAMLGFEGWQTHLKAGAALFEEILKNAAAADTTCPALLLSTVFGRLGSYSPSRALNDIQIPRAEQVGLRLSSAMLIFDDIIASTVLREVPRLHTYHDSLLRPVDGSPPLLDLELSIGCQNWVLLHISQISTLSAWKRNSEDAGTFNAIEHATRALGIKGSIERKLADLESHGSSNISDGYVNSLPLAQAATISLLRQQRPYITRVWAHAALLYLHVVVSGWQFARDDVRYLVSEVITLLQSQFKQLALVRTMMWPFCIAGILAEPELQHRFRELANTFRPRNLFPIAFKALNLVERIWLTRSEGKTPGEDFAACFEDEDTKILFV